MEVLEKLVGFGYGFVNNNEIIIIIISFVCDRCFFVYLECFCVLVDYVWFLNDEFF